VQFSGKIGGQDEGRTTGGSVCGTGSRRSAGGATAVPASHVCRHRRRRTAPRLRDGGRDAPIIAPGSSRHRLQRASRGVSDGDARQRPVVRDGVVSRNPRVDGERDLHSESQPGQGAGHRRQGEPRSCRTRRRPVADGADARRNPAASRPENAGRQQRVERIGIRAQSHDQRRFIPSSPFRPTWRSAPRRGSAPRRRMRRRTTHRTATPSTPT
jgi:hypothetical protein